jgi:hypothetical protein
MHPHILFYTASRDQLLHPHILFYTALNISIMLHLFFIHTLHVVGHKDLQKKCPGKENLETFFEPTSFLVLSKVPQRASLNN